MDKVKLVKKIYNRVLELGEERPDFVYTDQAAYDDDADYSCHYLSADGEGNGQGCIVGQAVQDVVPADQFNIIEMNEEAMQYIRHILNLNDDEFDSLHEILSDLDFIQGNQDAGNKWGVAVRIFKKVEID